MKYGRMVGISLASLLLLVTGLGNADHAAITADESESERELEMEWDRRGAHAMALRLSGPPGSVARLNLTIHYEGDYSGPLVHAMTSITTGWGRITQFQSGRGESLVLKSGAVDEQGPAILNGGGWSKYFYFPQIPDSGEIVRAWLNVGPLTEYEFYGERGIDVELVDAEYAQGMRGRDMDGVHVWADPVVTGAAFTHGSAGLSTQNESIGWLFKPNDDHFECTTPNGHQCDLVSRYVGPGTWRLEADMNADVDQVDWYWFLLADFSRLPGEPP